MFGADDQPWLLDLDTARRLRVVPAARAAADLARLARKVDAVLRVTRTDRVRFLKHYVETRRLPDWRRWWLAIERQADATREKRARGRRGGPSA